MRNRFALTIGCLCLLFASCEKETEGISKVTSLPQFEMAGKSFMNIKQDPDGTYEDPGVKAFVGEKEYPVTVKGSVDITRNGIYTIDYSTQSDEGFYVSIQRLVLVTPELVENDYSGTYSLTGSSRKKDITVSLVTGELGYYKASDCWWQNSPVPLYFLDLGGEELMVLTTTSPYGPLDVAGTIDTETQTIIFDVKITEGPNAGMAFKTSWMKKE